MATRSMIGLEDTQGRIEASYCHWDGHLSHVGKLLFVHYPKKSQVKRLLDLGPLVNLAETPESSETYGEETILFENRKSFEEYRNTVGGEYLYLFEEKKDQWVTYQHASPEKGWQSLEIALKEENLL